MKLTHEEKLAEIHRCQEIRERWENDHLGGFERIYPLQEGEEDPYKQYLAYAHTLYEEWTGASKREFQILFFLNILFQFIFVVIFFLEINQKTFYLIYLSC